MSAQLVSGKEAALILLRIARESAAATGNPTHWWAGFMCALAGSMAGQIGSRAAETILLAAADIVAEMKIKPQSSTPMQPTGTPDDSAGRMDKKP